MTAKTPISCQVEPEGWSQNRVQNFSACRKQHSRVRLEVADQKGFAGDLDGIVKACDEELQQVKGGQCSDVKAPACCHHIVVIAS